MTTEVRVWDWPLRLFHWLLVIGVTGAYLTGREGGAWTEWHARFGSLVLGLLVFRLAWGLWGPTPARFVNFMPTPGRILAYLKGDWHGLGHNPLGAIAVFALLAVLATLVGTGLFANDDIGFEGPLYVLVDKAFSDKLSGWHVASINLLLVLMALHITAIAFHQTVKKHDLVQAMLTGKKRVAKPLAPSDHPQPVGAARLAISVTLAASLVWSVWGGEPLKYMAQLVGVQLAHAGSQFE